MKLEPKFPDVRVQLSGTDSNIFSVIGRVTPALRKQGNATDQDIAEFEEQVFSSDDFVEALNVVMRWVRVS